MKSILFSLSLLLIAHCSFAQDSCSLRISLLTCAPGTELYSTFGHTAIRVQEDATGLDEVYNYGTFDGYDEDFYAKFVRGKLLYSLSVEPFYYFIAQYREESRSIVEQNLNLTCAQKAQLHTALQRNALPQNRAYRYDFLFDNCTTRAGFMVDTAGGAEVVLPDNLPAKPPTFRNLIYIYLNRGHQDWSKLGIDLLLGAKMDRAATAREAMFLPDNLMTAVDNGTIDGKPLVRSKTTILAMPTLDNKSLFITPIIAFSLLLAVAVALTLANPRWAKKAVGILDFLLFFSTGLVGLLLLFMWFGTDHALCANNYNLLWALPTNCIAAFFVHRRQGWSSHYFRFVAAETLVLIIGWAFLPQQMNPAFLPLVLTLGLRAFIISRNKRHGAKTA